MDKLIYWLQFSIIVGLSIGVFLLATRYYLHMFQLSGYNHKEFTNWSNTDKAGKRVKLFFLWSFIIIWIGRGLPPIWGVPQFSITFDFCVLIFPLLYGFIWFNFFRKKHTKKKLVYTNRMKRLLFTHSLITSAFIFLFVFLSYGLDYIDLRTSSIILYVIDGFILLSNSINKPIEKWINNGFIKEAKDILKANPNLKIIGVTGSYGKTSVKFYLKTLLEEHFNTLVTPESYNTPMGIVKTIRGDLKPIHEIFVCEMGAKEVGDIKEICDIVNPDWGVITAVDIQHLESFGTLENIIETKFELAESIKKEGKLFLNSDSKNIMVKEENYPNAIYYSSDKNNMNEKIGYNVENIKVSQYGTSFTVVTKSGERETFDMKLIGQHNIINVVGAIAVANNLGISLQDLKIPVRKLKPVNHRMEMIERGEITIIDDAFNANPVGSKAAVETLGMFDGLKILITPGMVDLGEEEYEYNYKFGGYAAENCDYILLVNKKRAVPIRKGALDKGFQEERCFVFDTLQEAMEKANSIKTEQKKYILLENDLTDNY